MKIVDLNILLYAVNQDADHHTRVRTWWERSVNGDESVGLAWVVLLGFLRISTNPKIFPDPLTVDRAIEKIDAWLSLDTVSLIAEKDTHWGVLRDILVGTGVAGNLATDAHLAAVAMTRGATLVSCDNDFARFANLRWENPLRGM